MQHNPLHKNAIAHNVPQIATRHFSLRKWTEITSASLASFVRFAQNQGTNSCIYKSLLSTAS